MTKSVLTSDQTIERLVDRARDLHTLPAVAMDVLELTDNPVVDTQALKACIERDAALTARLLRVVNSSLFGLSREVSDLNQALALLGTKPLKLLVLGFSLPSGLFGRVGSDILARYWRHTLTKAVAAREISQSIWNRPGDDSFIIGLLQDIGEMILIEELGSPYVDLLDKAFTGKVDLRKLEVEAMGFDHTELTSKLLDHWRLPESLVRTVRWNVTSSELDRISPDERAERQILRLAELLAKLLADGDTSVFGKLVDAGRDGHNLSKQRLDLLVEDLEEKVDNLADVLSLKLDSMGASDDSGNGYRALLDRAHQQLASTAASAAEDMLAARLGRESEMSCSTEAMALAEQLRTLGSAVKRYTKKPSSRSDHSSVSNDSNSDQSSKPVTPSSRPISEPVPLTSDIATVASADTLLLSRLEMAVTTCRQARRPLSLMMVELNKVDQIIFALGKDTYTKVCRWLELLCRNLEYSSVDCVPVREAAFALILIDCDRNEVKGAANELIQAVKSFAHSVATTKSVPHEHQPMLSVSVGAATVAMPPKNFPPESLVESAERCLYGSKASGGGVLKSIEIY
ncbi:MAG: HDOD domain-containing protein [Pirellulales bacterium]|nr:HDOD domain-containing protein [Pirellulales bacterium]